MKKIRNMNGQESDRLVFIKKNIFDSTNNHKHQKIIDEKLKIQFYFTANHLKLFSFFTIKI